MAVDLLIVVGKALAVVVVLMGLCAYTVLAERKVSSWIQNRVGPNRTTLPVIGAIPVLGPMLTRLGLFQPMADGLKFLFKEDILPGHVNKVYYMLAPVIALVPALLTVSVVPFGQYVDADGVTRPLILANLDIGILFIFAISSLGVYAIILAGWAANSKYPFLGGVRASAQMISYELAMGLSVLPVFLWINTPGAPATLSLVAVVDAQAGAWFVLLMPLSALIFLISIFAETNRAPFDMPESESELVGGFHTEYSSFKFGLFFVAEYAHMIVGSAILVLLFFGGWHPLPWLTLADLGLAGGVLGGVLSTLVFLAKTLLVVFFFIWVRWTVPRFRYDQVMRIGWRMLLPLAIANLIAYVLFLAWWVTR
ncbi:MAG: NADH-quinone oxidoreductase subunit H [Puniceicoccaceae bacterium]|nr:MAG: NADH-quinone oxidoreductase subunit H [Puniceicoccaceae bacterium]